MFEKLTLLELTNMKLLITSLLLYILIGTASCNLNKSSDEFSISRPWNSLTIIDDQRIVFIINNDLDSSTVEVHNIGSIFSPAPKEKLIDTFKVYFTKPEKDTLAYLTQKLIINPPKIKSFCTEFVGTIELKIDYGQFKQYGKYDSVCDWSLLSDQTKQLSKILKRNFKKIKNVDN
jgi:hypothetical protein